MKRCPNCNQVFSDDNIFCLNDGTTLEVLSSPAANDTPTQILSSFPTKAVEKKDANKGFYLIIGTMAVLIIGLSAIVFFLLSGKENTENKNGENKQEISETVENKPARKDSNPAQTSQIEKANKQISVDNTQVQTEPITDEAVRDLINRWAQAQNARNYNAYKACYASQFFGIKRTREGDESRMNYAQWMNDRRNMLRNVINVGVQNPVINIEGETATAVFIQNFESVNYQDSGQKVLKIKMFADGAKIIFEEMKYSY